MSATKVHWIREPNVGPTRVETHCGKIGWKAPHASDEFDDVHSNRFEASPKLSLVTCARCLRSARRISEEPCRRGAYADASFSDTPTVAFRDSSPKSPSRKARAA